MTYFHFSPNIVPLMLPFPTNCVPHREEEKEGVLHGALLSGRKIVPSHQFYLGLALAPVICFLEPWHFYLPACRGGGTNSEIRCSEMYIMCTVITSSRL